MQPNAEKSVMTLLNLLLGIADTHYAAIIIIIIIITIIIISIVGGTDSRYFSVR